MSEMKKKHKLGTQLILGMILFACSIVILVSAVLSIWFWGVETEDYHQTAIKYAVSASEYLDGDQIRTYLETNEPDSYYFEAYHFLESLTKNSALKYFYVFKPEEDHITYVWDVLGEEPKLLGSVDPYGSAEEHNVIQRVFSAKSSEFKEIVQEILVISEDSVYGRLGSVYYPVYDSEDNPVAVIGADIDVNMLFDQLIAIVTICIITVSIITLIAGFFYYIALRRRVIQPIGRLHTATKTLIPDLEKKDGGKPFEINVHTNNELEDLADSFVQMNKDLRDYIVRLETITREKEKLGAELNVAATIQKDMLPTVFPPFPERNEFEIYASMDPAREVGGDFYDFFLIDEDHIGLVIADVSDKGVPASLFMAISKRLLKMRAQSGASPKDILTAVNNQLCEGNDADQFVTVWLAVIDLKTGKGVAANGGHEHPVIRKGSKPYELVVYDHDMALGSFENINYHEHEFELDPGDTIFVYTDGVPEATNTEMKQFGTDRMIEALNTVPEQDPKKLIDTVTAAIDDFVKEAPQFDDTTMLAFCYFGPQSDAAEK